MSAPTTTELEPATGCGLQVCCGAGYIYAHEGFSPACLVSGLLQVSPCCIAFLWEPQPTKQGGVEAPDFVTKCCCPGAIYYHEHNECNGKVILANCCPCYACCCYTPTWVEKQKAGGAIAPPTMER